MNYLLYEKLLPDGVDPSLRSFLITVTEDRFVPRAKIAFPEFFSWNKPEPYPIPRSVYHARVNVLAYSGEDVFEAVAWFGFAAVTFETYHPGNTEKNTIALDNSFCVERDESYDGLTDENPWWFEHDGNQYLVLEVTYKDFNPDDQGVFLTAIHEKYVAE